MKMLWILPLFLIISCVSLKDYKAKQQDLISLTEDNKAIKKEISQLKRDQNRLQDTIKRRLEYGQLAATKINKRLASYRIKVKLGAIDIAGLNINQPDEDPEYSRLMLSKYTNRDTSCANKTTWLTAEEKKIYYYLNYARLNPKAFCNKYVLPKLEYDSNNAYILTLVDYLYTMIPRNAIMPDKAQYDAAKCHAETSGVLGYVGHSRQSDKCKSKFLGECCSYGVSDPLGIVLQLLIDNGVSSLGHRYICLGWYEVSGIAIAPHKGFGINTVLDFR